MNRQRPDLLGQGILFIVTRRVQQFRLAHAWVLVSLGLALIVAVVCLDKWVPRWTVCVLAVLLVLDTLLHCWINRAYSEGEVQTWQQVLGLADSVTHQARIDAAIKRTPPKPVKMTPYGPKPQLRVVRPDDEPLNKGR